MKYAAFFFFVFVFGIAGAEDRHPYIQEAEAHYQQGHYEIATQYLLAVPGVAHLMPAFTPMEKNDRARLFFDLGCTYLADRDSVLADMAFKEAFSLNDRLTRGFFEQSDSGIFWWALLRNQEASRRLKTKRLFAVMRSITLPGWGQFYRGHKTKGYAFLGATLVTSGILGLQYKNFREARRQYEEIDPNLRFIQRYPNEDGTQYTEWEARHRVSQARAKRVNLMLGILSAIWALNLADSAIFGPASLGPTPMGVTLHF